MILRVTLISLIFCMMPSLAATKTYMSQQAFAKMAFGNTPPPSTQTLWLNNQLQQKISQILDHRYPKLRLKYWQAQQQSVWILEEIGKEKPITFGVSIKNDRVHLIRVLAFRESRGWEIKSQSFTDQFLNIGLDSNGRLDQSIDGITGATMSVSAMKKITRVALMLAKTINQ